MRSVQSREFKLHGQSILPIQIVLREDLSELEFYGDLVYKLKKLTGRNDFSVRLFKKIQIGNDKEMTLSYLYHENV